MLNLDLIEISLGRDLDVGQIQDVTDQVWSSGWSKLNPPPSPLIIQLDLASDIYLNSVEPQDYFDEKRLYKWTDLTPNFDFKKWKIQYLSLRKWPYNILPIIPSNGQLLERKFYFLEFIPIYDAIDS